jgi:hypothetical protein
MKHKFLNNEESTSRTILITFRNNVTMRFETIKFATAIGTKLNPFTQTFKFANEKDNCLSAVTHFHQYFITFHEKRDVKQ